MVGLIAGFASPVLAQSAASLNESADFAEKNAANARKDVARYQGKQGEIKEELADIQSQREALRDALKEGRTGDRTGAYQQLLGLDRKQEALHKDMQSLSIAVQQSERQAEAHDVEARRYRSRAKQVLAEETRRSEDRKKAAQWQRDPCKGGGDGGHCGPR